MPEVAVLSRANYLSWQVTNRYPLPAARVTMRVGLEALTSKAVSLDPLELLGLTKAHALEGLHLSSRLLESRDDDFPERLAARAQANGLHLELSGQLSTRRDRDAA